MWNVIGHEWAVELLSRSLEQGQASHAYLFTGPPGIGRRTLALALAQALNCTADSARPCGVCRACTLIARGVHPDVQQVAATAIGGTLKIEQIRELQRSLTLAPFEARKRVVLILRFEEAHPAAANALLKTLEEPPEHVVLVLTARRLEDVLPTVVSRCQVLTLRPLPIQRVQQALAEHWRVPLDKAELLAHLSAGRLGWAVRWNQDAGGMERREQRLDELNRLLNDDRLNRFRYADDLAGKSASGDAAKKLAIVRETLDIWLTVWRDLLLLGTGTPVALTNIDWRESLERLAARFDHRQSQRALAATRQAMSQLDCHATPQLVLEVLLLSLPHR